MKLCSVCKRNSKQTPFGRDLYRCLECNAKRQKISYKKDIENKRKKALSFYWKNRDRIIENQKRCDGKVKDEVFNGYGGYECKCCGETEKKFLTIDHINGGGHQHRLNIAGGAKGIYRWLRKNNFPDGFRVLCYNCNCGRSRNFGICPHEKKQN